MKKRYLILLSLVLAAVFTFGSCAAIGETASQIAGAVVSSVSGEISSAISEGMNEISDGINDIKEGIDDAKENIGSAGNKISEEIGKITDKIADEINSGISETAENIITITSASSDDTTYVPAEDKDHTFRTQKLFDDHYKKHGAEFGDITQEQYLALANELIRSTSDTVLHKHTKRDDGSNSYDDKFFDTETGYFLVLSEDGYIRTFFIPSAGINYWNRQ